MPSMLFDDSELFWYYHLLYDACLSWFVLSGGRRKWLVYAVVSFFGTKMGVLTFSIKKRFIKKPIDTKDAVVL